MESSELNPFLRNGLRLALPLLPLLILIATGLRGLDFGLHWDEQPWQIGPVKHMIERGTPLPGYYNYPSFDYWLNLLVLSPDIFTTRSPGESVRQHLLRTLDSHAYLLRLRAVYLLITSLSVIWVYLLVLQHGRTWGEALFAASLLACSWEVAYHLRWVATDGMLMQFAILALLLASRALQTRSDFWLIIAAVISGVGFATKYPGGLLLLPVLLVAAIISAPGRERKVRLLKVLSIFVLVYLAITPATVLQPSKLAHAVFFEMKHYASGHGGHTISRGWEHYCRMFTYFATELWSPYLIIAILLFLLGIAGVAALVNGDKRQCAVFLIFPAAYVLYFGTQGTMIVRNLLAVVPFLAIASARGSQVVTNFICRHDPFFGRGDSKWLRIGWAALLIVCLGLNVSWLISSANSIVLRDTNRFVRDTGEYIRSHPSAIFLMSPRMKIALAAFLPSLQNVTSDPGKADSFVLYAREGMRRWHDWPANRRNLTQACFGPREVNFNIYPGWWGDDRIVVIDHDRANSIGLHIAGISPDPALEVEKTNAPDQPFSSAAEVAPDPLPGSWASNGMATDYLPAIDPRSLISREEAQMIMPGLPIGPASGGWELDGDACTYMAPGRYVLSVAIISTNAFALERPGSSSLTGVGLAAYVRQEGPPGDLRLFARTLNSAVVIHVSPQGGDAWLSLAQAIAKEALSKLDKVGALRTQASRGH